MDTDIHMGETSSYRENFSPEEAAELATLQFNK